MGKLSKQYSIVQDYWAVGDVPPKKLYPYKKYCSYAPTFIENIFWDICCVHDFVYVYKTEGKFKADFNFLIRCARRRWWGLLFGLVAQPYLWTYGVYRWYTIETKKLVT